MGDGLGDGGERRGVVDDVVCVREFLGKGDLRVGRFERKQGDGLEEGRRVRKGGKRVAGREEVSWKREKETRWGEERDEAHLGVYPRNGLFSSERWIRRDRRSSQETLELDLFRSVGERKGYNREQRRETEA